MKKIILNLLDALAIAGGLVLGAVAPWWSVWLLAFPLVYLGALRLIRRNTDFVWTA